ncbi:MAG: DNA-processing protein DprA [Candidatus Dormibacteria bacterium]
MSRGRLGPGDPGWPSALEDLAHLGGSPRVRSLWVEGELPALPGVAVVGARRAGAAGLEAARRIGGDLGRRGVTVVSGFARGVDAAAHRGCLEAGGRTVAVLGCGLDAGYPPHRDGLRAEVARGGALVTEYELDDAPAAWHFPQRNRVIAALARAVVVVEAGTDSGALSTARWAADLGREVLAVPGSILGPASAGSNRLLRDGARPYLDLSDLADVVPECAIPVASTCRRRPVTLERAAAGSGAGSEAPSSRLLAVLGGEAVHRELLAGALELSASRLAVLLAEMELAGVIRSLPGGMVARARW